MPYSVTTQDGFTLDGIPDGLEPNSPEVLAEIQKLRVRNQASTKQKESQTSNVRVVEGSNSNFIEDIAKGFGSGVTGMLESSALGMATLLEEEAELKARSKIKDIFDIDMLKGADQDSILYKLSSGIGSIAALAPAALAGPAALPVAGAVAAGAGAGEASERARAYGATEEERSSAALRGTAIGLTEVTPLGRLSKAFKLPGIQKTLNKLGPKAVENIGSRVRNAAVTGVVEGAQEGAAAILQNLNEQGYNPERELVDSGVLEEALIGGGAGAILQALADVFVKGKEYGPAPYKDDGSPETPAESTPVEETPVKETPVEETPVEVDPKDVDAVAGERLGATNSEEAINKEIDALILKAEGTGIDVEAELSARDAESGGETFTVALTEVNNLVDKKKEESDVGESNETGVGASIPVVAQSSDQTETNVPVTDKADGTGVGSVKQVATNVDGGKEGQTNTVEENLIASVKFDEFGQVEGGQKAASLAQRRQSVIEQSQALKNKKDKEKRYADKKPVLAPETEARNELKARGDAVGINVQNSLNNYTSNQEDPNTGKNYLVGAAVIKVEQDIKDMEVEIASQEADKERLTGIADAAIPARPASIETSPPPADRSVVVDNKFVSSIGLTGSNKVFGDRLIEKFGSSDSDTGGVVTNRDLATSLRDNSDTQGRYKLTYNEAPAEGQEKGKLITKSYDTKAEQSKAASNAVKTGATEVKTPTLKPVKLNKKAQAYVDKYAGKPAIKGSVTPTANINDVKDKALLKGAGKNIGSDKGDAAGKLLTPKEMNRRSQEVIDKEGVDQFVEPNLRVAPKNETSEQKVERQRLLAEEDQVFVDQIEDVLGGANAFRLLDGGASLLPNNYVNVLDGVVSVKAKNALKKGDLRAALMLVSAEASDMRTKQIARVLSESVGNTKVRFADGDQSFVSSDGTVNIVGDGEVFIHTVLHEATHASVDKVLDNLSHPMTKKLTTLYNEAKPNLDSAYGARSLKEFVSEALSNSEFQQKLAGLNPDGSATSALDRFFRVVTNFIRSLIGAGTNSGALDTLDQSIIAFLATSPDTRGAGSTYKLGTRDGVEKILNELGVVQKSFAPPTKKFREEFGIEGGSFLDSVTDMVTKRGALQLLDIQAVGDVANAKGYGDMGTRLRKLVLLLRGKSNQADQLMSAAVEKASKWAMKNPAEQKIIDQIIYSRDIGSTIHQVDPTIKTRALAEERYGKDPEKLAIWDEQQKVWKSLPKSAKDQYIEMRDVYKTQYLQMKKVITGRMEEVLGKEEADKLQATVFDRMFDTNALDVYFPLVREGKYKLSYTPARGKGQNVVRDDKDNYVVEMFESKKDREKAVVELKLLGVDPKTVKMTDGDLNARNFRENAPPNSFVSEVLTALDRGKVDESVQNEVMNLFIDSLPETSFAKSMKTRKGLEGYKHDSILAMRSKGFDIARQVQRIDIGGRIRALEVEIRDEQAKLAVNNPNSDTTTAIGDDMLARAKFAVSGAERKALEGVVKNANQLAFIYTIGFNASSALVNLSQLPLFVGPMLGAEFGHIKAGKAMTEAIAMVMSSGNEIDSYYDMKQDTTETVGGKPNDNFGKITYTLKKDVDPAIAKEYGPLINLITMASERSYLTQSYLADAMGLDEGTQSFEWLREKVGMKASGRVARANVAEKGLNSVSAVSAIMFNAGERFNRQVTLLSGYKLSLETIENRESKKPEDQRLSDTQIQEEASENALYMSQEYNGGAVLETGSRISSEGVGRVAFMYKNYGLRMYTTMFKVGKRAIDLQFFPPKNETAPQKKERMRLKKIAWAQARAMHLSALLVAGIQGMPLYGAVALAMDLFLDDEEDDADTVVRKYFGEGWYKGPAVNALGIDFSKRVRLNSLLFEANRYSRDASVEEDIFHHLGGPAFSTGKRFIRAGKDFSEGELQRGIESLLPAGITNVVRNSPIGRYQQEGAMKTRRGDVIYDDLTSGDFFSGMVGFPPTGYTFAQEQTNIEQRISGAVTKKRSKLLKQYYVARRQGDYPESKKVFKDMKEFSKRHPNARITYESLKRSYTGHQRTTAKMHNGTTLSPMMKKVLEQERKEYDTSSLFD